MLDNNTLSYLLHPEADRRPKLERALLKDQAIELLRDHIVSGRFPPGTKLVEREVAELLGVSRAPARDALRELESEGLVVSKSTGRHVIKITRQDVRELYQVRLVLEKLAVELATQNRSPERDAALTQALEGMRAAVAQHDRSRHVSADVAMHVLVWKQADNRHLLNMLRSIIGPVLVFVASNADTFNWQETLALHEDMAASVIAGQTEAAVQSIEHHLENAVQRSLHVFQNGE